MINDEKSTEKVNKKVNKSFLDKVKRLGGELSELNEMIKNASPADRKKLEEQKVELEFQMERILLEYKLQDKGPSVEIAKQFGDLDARIKLHQKELAEKETNKYSLSSGVINSKIDGKPVNLNGYSLDTRIGLIYRHTGEVMSANDEIFEQDISNNLKKFINFLSTQFSNAELKSKYGDDWQQRVTELYTQGYKSSVNNHISKIINTIDKENNNIEQKSSPVEESSLAKENAELKEKLAAAEAKLTEKETENMSLQSQITTLKDQLTSSNQKRLEDIANVRESFEKVLANEQIRATASTIFTEVEKYTIIKALGITLNAQEHEVDESLPLIVTTEPGETIEKSAHKLMICNVLGINADLQFNNTRLKGSEFKNEEEIVNRYNTEVYNERVETNTMLEEYATMAGTPLNTRTR